MNTKKGLKFTILLSNIFSEEFVLRSLRDSLFMKPFLTSGR